jgi:hypothetical protein
MTSYLLIEDNDKLEVLQTRNDHKDNSMEQSS